MGGVLSWRILGKGRIVASVLSSGYLGRLAGAFLLTRLNVSQEAFEAGHRCGFEETGMLWQCHLSGERRLVVEDVAECD